MSQPTGSQQTDEMELHEPGVDVLPEIEVEVPRVKPDSPEVEGGQSWHVPLFIGVAADIILKDGYFEITIYAFGERVDHLNLEQKSAGKTSGTGEFQLPAVKGKITFTADWKQHTLRANGSICGYALFWHCSSIDKQLISW
jgi:hypothetical protein